MAVTERRASVVWEGDHRVAAGTVQPASAAFDVLISVTERVESESAVTSPEELIASAAAASYAISLQSALSAQGDQPQRVDVSAVCLLERTADGLSITRLTLDVKAAVPRLQPEAFQEVAQKAEQRCLVSNALRGNVAIELTAELVPVSATNTSA
jgi:osmotically inducible protein OsmC